MTFKISKNSAFKKWTRPEICYIIGYEELMELIENNKSLKPPSDYSDFIKWIDTLGIKNENGKLKIIKY